MVLINWLYIAVTSFLAGYGILSLFANLFSYKIRHGIAYFWAGLAFATVYAQFFSLFGGVSVGANIGLCLISIISSLLYRKDLSEYLAEQMQKLRMEKWRMPVYLFLILLSAYGTSRGYMHFDTSLYHAQSIRWIEEYGVVPGLANVQSRFGYNSAAFPLTALYSMKGIFGQSLHTTAGFFALLASFSALDLYKVFRSKKVDLADFARIGLVFYLGVIFSQMMSPASDYYAQVLLFVILILWLEEDVYQKETGVENVTPYGLLCILIVYAVTIKFSVAVLLLLVIKPAVMLLKKKDVKQISVCITFGFLTALPFFVRNVIISGWLLYPFAGIDLFSVDWKLPKGQVQYDSMEIGLYGRGITDVTKHATPFSEWFPAWFAGLKSLEKLFILATVAAFAAGAAYLLWIFIKNRKKNVDKNTTQDGMNSGVLWKTSWNFALVFLVFGISTVFWFVSAPLVRYGYAYITVVPLITFGEIMLRMWNMKKIQPYSRYIHWAFCILLAGFLLTRVEGLADDIRRTWKEPYYIAQMDYMDGEAVTQEVDGVTFYVPTDSGLIGYEKFPASLFVWPIELRGESIKEGFRQIIQE